jgi:hypothetical protein
MMWFRGETRPPLISSRDTLTECRLTRTGLIPTSASKHLAGTARPQFYSLPQKHKPKLAGSLIRPGTPVTQMFGTSRQRSVLQSISPRPMKPQHDSSPFLNKHLFRLTIAKQKTPSDLITRRYKFPSNFMSCQSAEGGTRTHTSFGDNGF